MINNKKVLKTFKLTPEVYTKTHERRPPESTRASKTFPRFTGTRRTLEGGFWRGGAAFFGFYGRKIVEIFEKYFYDHAIIRSSS